MFVMDMWSDESESIKAEGEIVMFNEFRLLYPLATIQSLSLESGDVLFFLQV